MKWYLAHDHRKEEVWINMELVTVITPSHTDGTKVRIYFQGSDDDFIEVNGPIGHILNDILPGNTAHGG